MAATQKVQIVSDSNGNPTGVIVPIDLWREISSERETAYLLSSPAMRSRILTAIESQVGISLAEVKNQLGI